MPSGSRPSPPHQKTPRGVWPPRRAPPPGQRYPNNWQSVFGGRAWEWDEATRQFYYHMFLKQQPDVNWRNPALRQTMMDVVRTWLDRGVDGFRLDVFRAWFKDADPPANPPPPAPPAARGAGRGGRWRAAPPPSPAPITGPTSFTSSSTSLSPTAAGS